MSGLVFKDVDLDLGGSRILRGVSGAVTQGEIVGLIGPNGAGKSSLLRSILGLAKIGGGIVELDGADVLAMAPKARARLLAFAAQGAPVHWPLHVEKLVGLGRVPHLDPWRALSDADRVAIDNALEVTDCLHLRERIATTLSGGERARVLLARTIASGAPWLLADEPLASLDPFHQLQVMRILKEHARAGGAVMVAMHDLDLALRYCDKLILLHEGHLVDQGEPNDILNDANLREVFGVSASRWNIEGQSFLVPREVMAPSEFSSK